VEALNPGPPDYNTLNFSAMLPPFLRTVLEISARPLDSASLKSAGQVQLFDHLPVSVWRVQFSLLRIYLRLNMDNLHYFSFTEESSLKENLTLLSQQ